MLCQHVTYFILIFCYFLLLHFLVPLGVIVLWKYTVKKTSLPEGPSKFRQKNQTNNPWKTDTWTVEINWLKQLRKKCSGSNMFEIVFIATQQI